MYWITWTYLINISCKFYFVIPLWQFIQGGRGSYCIVVFNSVVDDDDDDEGGGILMMGGKQCLLKTVWSAYRQGGERGLATVNSPDMLRSTAV